MSLRRQFIVVFVTFSAVLTAMGGFGTYWIVSRTLEEEMDDKLQEVAGVAVVVGFETSGLELLLAGEEQSTMWASAHARLRGLENFVAAAWIFRTDDYTAIVSSFPADSVQIGTPLPEFESHADVIERAKVDGSATSLLFPGEDGQQYKYGFVPIQRSPDLMLAVRMRADYLEPLASFRRRIVQVSAASVVIAAVLAWFLAANVTGPLDRLSRVALRIQRGWWAEAVREEPGKELGRLSRAMERMRAGILEREEQLRLMLAQVAHEVRNPLGGLELFATAAAEADTADEREHLLGRVRGEINSLNLIIDDFLTFARPLDPVLETHDARLPLREAVDLLDSDGKEIVVDLPVWPLLVHADPGHLKRVALNLLRNAAQASASKVQLYSETAGDEVLVCVRDDGPGVPEELRERIFEPFVTDKEKGAGLGLAIVQKLVEVNGGRLELAPRLDGEIQSGAEFRVYWRAADRRDEVRADG
ncbi:MAG: HAMP domain-containing histidine kinase [Gemmatimonadetes bacterium]|nr:HAMP domain-containing histidine kinase [Gemmatimonadota bacterium]